MYLTGLDNMLCVRCSAHTIFNMNFLTLAVAFIHLSIFFHLVSKSSSIVRFRFLFFSGYYFAISLNFAHTHIFGDGMLLRQYHAKTSNSLLRKRCVLPVGGGKKRNTMKKKNEN